MTIAYLTLGCKLNYAETSTYERGFKAAGLETVSWKEKADVYVINTCTVTATSDSKSRNLIRKVHRVNPDAVIVVTGCSAELRRRVIEAIDGVTLVFGAHDKAALVPNTLKYINKTVASPAACPTDCCPSPALNILGDAGFGAQSAGTTAAGEASDAVVRTECAAKQASPQVFAAYSTGERTRSFLKVQDGCNNFCKYCTVPFARGESRNIPICEAVRNAEAIAAEGVKEIVLTGVNTGDFGRTTGESFLDLLKALDRVEGIERYRISSIEPNLLTHEIIDWIASGTKFQPHFHIPLQTGTDIQLQRMGRKYTTDFFASLIAHIRERMEGEGKPRVFFGIDVMVGLPGETDSLFEDTVRFIESIRPSFIHVFPYSRRPGTEADRMDGQVSEEEKKRRVAVLEGLCSKLHDEFVQSEKGKEFSVLLESRDRNGSMSGYTENYIRVEMPYKKDLVGKVSKVIL